MLKFKREKSDGLMGVETRFICGEKEPGFDTFEIVATLSGVQFKGRSPNIFESEDVEELARTIGQAFTEHSALLKSKIQCGSMH